MYQLEKYNFKNGTIYLPRLNIRMRLHFDEMWGRNYFKDFGIVDNLQSTIDHIWKELSIVLDLGEKPKAPEDARGFCFSDREINDHYRCSRIVYMVVRNTDDINNIFSQGYLSTCVLSYFNSLVLLTKALEEDGFHLKPFSEHYTTEDTFDIGGLLALHKSGKFDEFRTVRNRSRLPNLAEQLLESRIVR